MKRTVLIYGASMALLVALMKMLEYRYFVRDLKLEFYVGAVAVVFVALGVWVGMKFTTRKPVVVPVDFQPNENKMTELGISRREMDVLEAMAQGLSNQEIADKLFVSVNTVKTHSANLFSKLQVSRRTQAIRQAKSIGLLP